MTRSETLRFTGVFNFIIDEMSKRLNQDRQSKLEPRRIFTTRKTLEQMGFEIQKTKCEKGLICNRGETQFIIFPFSGWWSGKNIGSGRGFVKLIEKL